MESLACETRLQLDEEHSIDSHELRITRERAMSYTANARVLSSLISHNLAHWIATCVNIIGHGPNTVEPR